ncbi:NAD-dependent malic enzyme [Paludibaculum fermentans]|uniref:Malolactic enzyme n=1 Tax=Paludibaculum fermentans TaxID=1473598 RepID=A0A7S7SPQ9_PALFE|nr:NAD-dependent malic enzyme [Paludibaculum fermentans]
MTKHRRNWDGCYETKARGLAVLSSPMLNKGTAFSAEERKALGLTGLLPPEVSTLEAQVKRAYLQYEGLTDALSKNIYLTALHDRNEVLFYRLFSEHLREMIPIVNDLTVGIAMEQYHHECRPPRGVYLSIDHIDGIEEAFVNLGAAPSDIDLILATDAEQILGIGDWGVGGIEVSIGKLAIYTAAGGIDPTRVIPVMLDVGTNRENLRDDPTYIGNRHARIRGVRYDEFIEAYVSVVRKLFPNALLQWEDFAPANGRRILEKYRGDICTFNDDMQGTGAITLAAAISAVRASGSPLRNQRVVIFGAGTAGIGVADQIRNVMLREGLSKEEAARRFWCVDRQGLLTADMGEQLGEHQMIYARPAAESKTWKREGDGVGIGLSEVVRRVNPTMLIGASATLDAFTEEIVKEMAAHCERPIIFVLSNPRHRAEAKPADLIAWTDGRALIATGGSFSPVTYKGVTYVVAQVNNAMLYPGLALGAIVSQASRISDGMFIAAASAVSSLVTVRQPGASILPHIDDLRSVSATVAVAVAEAAVVENLAGVKFDDIVQQVQDAMWQPEYRRIQAS